ncbi:MAG: hypothetical protein ACQKBY_09715 [Verrucomicrobiales bacterium]
MKYFILLSSLVLISTANSATIYIDFGGSDHTGNWNGIASTNVHTVSNLIDSTGANTGYALSITNDFSGVNGNGTTSGGPYPGFATDDSHYGQSTNPAAAFQLQNLDPSKLYTLTFYGSRMSVSDNRETEYTVTGDGASQVLLLDVANNVTETISTTTITPTAGGIITVDLQEGPNNTNSSGFFYIGALEINVVPEPSTALLSLALPALLLRRRRN